MHAHTAISPCATISWEKLVALAAARGINTLFITDHDRISAAEKAVKASKLRVIVGEEVATADGEILGLFLRREIAPGLSAEETAKRIKDQGGVVAVPHPCDTLRRKRFNPAKLEGFLASGLCDCVEAWNARNVFTGANVRAEKLAVKYGLPVFGGSDSHTGIEVGRSGTVMEDFSDSESFLKSLKNAEIIKRKSPIWVHGITKVRRALIRFGGESLKL